MERIHQIKIERIFLASIALLLLIAGCSNADSTHTTELTKEPPEAIQWEYLVLTAHDLIAGAFLNLNAEMENMDPSGYLTVNNVRPELQTRMNDLGMEGWELVGFSGGADDVSVVMVFKRLIN